MYKRIQSNYWVVRQQMTDQRDPFAHNKLLYEAQEDIVPMVLRDFRVMKQQLDHMISVTGQSIAECEQSADQLISDSHGDDCTACVLLRNMHRRYLHDLGLYRAHLRNIRSTWTEITKPDKVNSAQADQFLAVALTARALLDNIFRSCVLFSQGDIRAYNKQIADSLYSFSKLVWSTLPQNINHNIGHVLEEYATLSNSQKNKSDLYFDPAPTFKAKVEYMKDKNRAAGFSSFFDECESFYNALSDMVHGGSAALAASDHKGHQIVLATPDIRYVASAHQLAELIGITAALSSKLLINFYFPVLIHTLSRIEGAERIGSHFESVHRSLVSKTGSFNF